MFKVTNQIRVIIIIFSALIMAVLFMLIGNNHSPSQPIDKEVTNKTSQHAKRDTENTSINSRLNSEDKSYEIIYERQETTLKTKPSLNNKSNKEERVAKRIKLNRNNINKSLFETAEYNFYIEIINEKWREENENKIFKIFEKTSFNNAVLNGVTCRSQTCRASITHLTMEESKKFFHSFYIEMNDTSNYQLSRLAQLDGSITSIILFKPINKTQTPLSGSN